VKLSQIKPKHTQVDLKSLVSRSPHTMQIQMRCRIWPMDAQRFRSSFGSSHNWLCAVVVRSVSCVRSLAHLPYLFFDTENKSIVDKNGVGYQRRGKILLPPIKRPEDDEFHTNLCTETFVRKLHCQIAWPRRKLMGWYHVGLMFIVIWLQMNELGT
jgi:hypothetical protein